MKKAIKLRVLSTQESKQQTAAPFSSDSAELCSAEIHCADGNTYACSGTSCTAGQGYIECDYNGNKTHFSCGNAGNDSGTDSGTDSGSSETVASTPEEACSGAMETAQCHWIDKYLTPHYGQCKRDSSRPGNKLYCDEY